MSLRRKALGWLLSLTLALGMVPAAAMTAFAAEGDPVVIDQITITDVPLPVAGKKAGEVPIESTLGPAGAFEVTDSGWLTAGSSVVGVDSKFYANTYYLAHYTLQPKEGYVFDSAMTAEDVIVDAGVATSVFFYNDGRISIKVKRQSHDGTRTEVSSLEATSNIASMLAYGADVEQPTFTPASGSHVTFSSSYLYWQKSTGTSWADFTGDTFTAGTYRLKARVEVDSESTATHVLGYPLALSVDGAEWAVDSVDSGRSPYAYVTSPEFTVEAPPYAPLVFEDSNNYDIAKGFTNEPMTAFSVKAGVSGGTEPYAFSKVSGPDWVSVSADGTLSGTPTAAGANGSLVVRVTDADGSTAEISIYVGDTRLGAADRAEVGSIAATSDISSVLAYGSPRVKPAFAMTSGEPAYFDINPSYWYGQGRWMKYDEATGYWNDYNDDATFNAGKYKFTCYVRIDGYTHAFDEGLSVTVDGVEWEVGSIVNDDYDGSEAFVTSPEFRIYDPAFEAFTDVPEGAWFYNPVAWAVENGVTSGLSATEFGPNATCTRAQAVTFLWNAAGKPAPSSTDMPFTDVKETAWYRDAVLWAVEQGITSGTSATTFSPNAKCTRAQIVTFLWNFEGKPAPGATASPFTDVKAGAWYFSAVLWAVEEGVTAGTSATTFGPSKNCTRAQIVTFMYNYMG